MALTYEESSGLMSDPNFRGRVKVACLKYADYISAEGPGTPAHTTRLRWATMAMQNPDQVAGQVQPSVVMEDAVQAAGSAVTDGDLQVAVETVVNKML